MPSRVRATSSTRASSSLARSLGLSLPLKATTPVVSLLHATATSRVCWAVLSGVGDVKRVHQAMAAVDEQLVRPQDGLVQLLAPPFDTDRLDPGYIRGYVPGVRENGGQYTHAAVWAAMAFVELGEPERAWALLRIINPVRHTLSAEGVMVYKIEPYVMAADVYARAPHVGRGGWSWHTGAAGWMYRLVLESLLGVRREGRALHLSPRLPADWPAVKIDYRFGGTVFHIVVQQDGTGGDAGTVRVSLDGILRPDGSIPLVDDLQVHQVEVNVTPKRDADGGRDGGAVLAPSIAGPTQ